MKNVFPVFFLLIFSICQSQEYVTINSSNLTVKIIDQKKVSITDKYTMTIHNKKGESKSIIHEYYDKFRNVKSISVQIKDSRGKKVKSLNKSDAIDYAFNASYETADTRRLYLDPDYKVYPFIMEVEINIEYNGYLNLPLWLPREDFNTSVEESSLKVIVPDGYKLRFLSEHIEDPIVMAGEVKKNTTYAWHAHELPVVHDHMDYKTFFDSQPKVYLAPGEFKLAGYEGKMNSWEGFGNWFLSLNKNRNEITEETKDFLHKLEGTKSEIVSKVYEYMQKRTRYVSIQLGIGGFQSLPAIHVDEKGYGECKALTNYTRAMLSYKGIYSNYILARAGKDVPEVKETFPSNQFNHVFLGVPLDTDTMFLECTSQTIPPGYLGTFTDDRNVLWIEENGSKIIRSPVYDEEDNRITKHAELKVDENGDGQLQLITKHEGVFYDGVFVYQHLSENQVEEHNYAQFKYKDFTIKSVENKENKRSASYTSTFDLSISNIGRKSGDKLLLPVNTLQPVDHYIKADRYNKFCEIKRGFTLTEQIDIELPGDFWIRHLDHNQELESDFGSYSITISYEEGFIQVNRKLTLKKGKYELDQFDTFYEYIKKIKRSDNQKLVLESKT